MRCGAETETSRDIYRQKSLFQVRVRVENGRQDLAKVRTARSVNMRFLGPSVYTRIIIITFHTDNKR